MQNQLRLTYSQCVNIARFSLAGLIIFLIAYVLTWIFSKWTLVDPAFVPLTDALAVSITALGVIYLLFFKPLLQEGINHSHGKREFDRVNLFDQLTNLPNSILFIEQLKHEIQNTDRFHRPFALILVRVHHLAEINGTLGHKLGDETLKIIAQRLRQGLRKSDTVSRYDGNVFCLLLPGVEERLAYIVSRKLQLLLEEKIILDDIEISIETSGGIVLYPKNKVDHHQLIRFADIASRRDRIGHNRYHIYDLENNNYAKRQLTIYSLLKEAVTNESGLTLHYQPKINIQTGIVESVESLARWETCQLGVISPIEFIAIAERTALIRPFTWKIIEMALNDIVYWREKDLDIRVAINLSTHNLYDPQLLDKLLELLQQRCIPTDRLELEITESALLDDEKKTIVALTKLKDAGFSLTVDDFGTGYSSLAYLSDLPVNCLKIDQSFVKEMCIHQSKLNIIQFTIELAHSLGLRVVAEGVEDQQSLDLLRNMNCDIAQGFYLSRPLSTEALKEFVNLDHKCVGL